MSDRYVIDVLNAHGIDWRYDETESLQCLDVWTYRDAEGVVHTGTTWVNTPRTRGELFDWLGY